MHRAARQARRVLERADALSANIRFHRWPTNRVWLRDSGCIFLKPQPDLARRTAEGSRPRTNPESLSALDRLR